MQFARASVALHCCWEQQLLKLDTAVPYHCCQAVVCTGALISTRGTLPEAMLQRTVAVSQFLFEQQIFACELIVRHFICYLLCSAHSTEWWGNVFCQGQCCAALLLGRCVSSSSSNLTLQCHTTAVRLLSAQEP